MVTVLFDFNRRMLKLVNYGDSQDFRVEPKILNRNCDDFFNRTENFLMEPKISEIEVVSIFESKLSKL